MFDIVIEEKVEGDEPAYQWECSLCGVARGLNRSSIWVIAEATEHTVNAHIVETDNLNVTIVRHETMDEAIFRMRKPCDVRVPVSGLLCETLGTEHTVHQAVGEDKDGVYTIKWVVARG